MKITNYLESRCVSRRNNVSLYAAFAFCTILIVASGCASTGGSSCCLSKSNDPEKLATINEPSSEATSRAQSTDVSNVSVPSEESQERHNKAFTGAVQDVPQTTTDTEGVGDAAPLVNNASTSNSPIVESLDSLNYMANTAKPTNDANIPDVTGVPAAQPQAPSENVESQNSKQVASVAEQVPISGGFTSVAPSPGQENQGTSGERLANSNVDSVVVNSEVGVNTNVQSGALEPPVETNPEKVPATFAEETDKTDGSVETSGTSSVVSEKENASTSRLNESTPSQAPDAQTVDPTLDTSVPVTFKPTAFSRVVEIQPTGASEVLDSGAKSSQRSAQRVAFSSSLVSSGIVVGKPIDASKDVSHLTRIPRR